MIRNYDLRDLARVSPGELSDALEQGNIVYFPESPVPFPNAEDLRFLRHELPRHLRRKNISLHPEVDRVVGIAGSPEVQQRALQVLSAHSIRVQQALRRLVEPLARGWTVATSSFRPLQERGRALPAHASNERVHVDAGAYGATHGNRILRFFMNANTAEDRVWVTKGPFPEVYRRYGRVARVAASPGTRRSLAPGVVNRLYSGLLGAIAKAGFPLARLADTSPYDRLMRRFHNYMKDSEEFQSTRVGHGRFVFPPGSAWMVFTDMLTHACVEGQHAFIDTFMIPLANCRKPELAPYHLLESSP